MNMNTLGFCSYPLPSLAKEQTMDIAPTFGDLADEISDFIHGTHTTIDPEAWLKSYTSLYNSVIQ